MFHANLVPGGAVFALVAAIGPIAAGAAADEKILFEFNAGFDLATVATQDAQVSLAPRDGGAALRVATGRKATWPGITLRAPEGHWDLARFDHVAVDVRNPGTRGVEVFCRIDSVDPDGTRRYHQQGARVEPGETTTLRVTIRRRLPAHLADKLFGMRGYPGGMAKDGGIDAAKVDQLLVFVSRPSQEHLFEIDDLRAGGSHEVPAWRSMDAETFFPMIDTFGQFIHKDWPGKTESVEDLHERVEAEARDLAAHPGPGGWNRYGGWADGPRLEATGRFRAEKHRGKWWLVDPEGRLFWSHGADCVRWTTGATPITDRKHWYADLPGPDSPLAAFYGRGAWAPHGYYQGKAYETFNFTGANLLRKYGPEWRGRFAELCHRRLRSWGMNTIANWSDPEIYRMGRTAYVATVSSGRKPLEGSSGYWGKFPDVFDPDFEASLKKHFASARDTTADDPWCIGYFVDNELSWGDELSLAVAALASPPEQAAKKVFVDELKAKYATIDKLNAAWQTEHASWEALLESRTPPDRAKARDDLAAFYTRTAEQYFRACREAVKRAAPDALYLGCRFAWVNDRAVRAAAKYCDVVSFNKYQYRVDDFRLPDGVDKPVVIGEFHFGALDRGMFHTGLRAVANQSERAEAYRDYVRGALENPWLVGTHWFQFGDQATTGRGDGENYQIGLLDVCDTPYRETIEALREVGASMYARRLGER